MLYALIPNIPIINVIVRSIKPNKLIMLYDNKLVEVMLWSQIIYGHRTASISPIIERFYGARTVPGRRQEESYDFLSFFRHRTVPGEF